MKNAVRLCVLLTVIGAALSLVIPLLAVLFPSIQETFAIPERLYHAVTHSVSLSIVLYLVHIINEQMTERREFVKTVTESLSRSSQCPYKS